MCESGGDTGAGPAPDFLTSTEVYQPVTGTWAPAAPMLAAQAAGGSALLPSGEVFAVTGLASASTTPTTTTQIYTPATLPGAPGSVAATPVNHSAIVTWSPPASTGGSPIVHYTVVASTGQRLTTPDGSTTVVLTGLTNGTRVTFTVSATNGVGTGPASSASNAITPMAPDTTPPALVITRLSTKVKLKSFLKHGITFTVTPNESSSFDIALLASASTAHISKSYNLTLASETLRRGTGARRITLKPNRRLIGGAKKFSLLLRVIATDAAGNRSTVSKTIRVRP